MGTKYIVNNVSGQTINGNITITGSLNSSGIATYRALLTQTGSLTGTTLNNFNGKLIIGETYTIVNYVEDADFSNIADVQSGVINQTGCVFIATGATPNSWNDGTELSSGGGMIVDVLENTLGYDLEWSWGGFGPGTGVGYNTSTGPVINTFSRNVTYVTSQINSFTYGVGNQLEMVAGPSEISYVDDAIFVGVWDWTLDGPVDNTLYYSPIEITIKQDTDVTPIVLSGTIESGFPIIAPAVDLFCNNTIVGDFYGNGEVDNIGELITELNTPQEYDLSFLGTYSDPGDGNILLTMKTNLKNQFCPTGTLTFEVYDND
jgi:hypothetical protein